MIFLLLAIGFAIIGYLVKIFFELPVFPVVAGFLFIFYIVYNWFDYFFSKRYKKIQAEDPIFPRLKTGLKPTLRDLNLDVSEKILHHDFDSNDSESSRSDD